MTDLLVRGIDEKVVRALKERAGMHGRSAEAEHRDILTAALSRSPRRSFADVLASMKQACAQSESIQLSVMSFGAALNASAVAAKRLRRRYWNDGSPM